MSVKPKYNEVPCPSCGEPVAVGAYVCSHCDACFSNAEVAARVRQHRTSMASGCAVIGTVPFCLLVWLFSGEAGFFATMAKILGAVILLSCMAAVPAGLLMMVAPRLMRVGSRWYGLPIVTSLVGLSGVVVKLIGIDSDGKPGGDTGAAIAIFVFWLIISAPAIWAARRSERKGRGAAPTANKPSWWERIATAYGAGVERERTRQKIRKTEREIVPGASRNPAPARSLGAAPSNPYLTPPPARYVAAARAAATPKPKIAYDTNRPSASRGRLVSFEYVDAHGEITEREVSGWQIEDGYISGHCRLRDEFRQFRIDRVIQWKAWR